MIDCRNENRRVNLKHLEHLLVLAELGSFSRAAARIHITQSALSRSIRALEQELGGQLVDRIGHRNELTPLGRAVVLHARQVTDQVEDLRSAAQSAQTDEGGVLRVGLGSGPGGVLMTPLLKHVASNYSHLRVRILRGPIAQQMLQLRARELDALVVDWRQVAPAPDLAIEPLGDLRAGCICRAGHPLASLASVRLEQILHYPLASTRLSDEVARQLVQQYGMQAAPANAVRLECEELSSLLETVAETDAIYLGIIAAARAGLERGELHELPLTPRLAVGAKFVYVTIAGRTQTPVMGMFRQFVDRHLHD